MGGRRGSNGTVSVLAENLSGGIRLPEKQSSKDSGGGKIESKSSMERFAKVRRGQTSRRISINLQDSKPERE